MFSRHITHAEYLTVVGIVQKHDTDHQTIVNVRWNENEQQQQPTNLPSLHCLEFLVSDMFAFHERVHALNSELFQTMKFHIRLVSDDPMVTGVKLDIGTHRTFVPRHLQIPLQDKALDDAIAALQDLI